VRAAGARHEPAAAGEGQRVGALCGDGVIGRKKEGLVGDTLRHEAGGNARLAGAWRAALAATVVGIRGGGRAAKQGFVERLGIL
jgi:hypothetical protein